MRCRLPAIVRLLANQPLLSRSFQRMDVDLLHSTVTGKSLRAKSLAPRGWRALERATAPCPDSPLNTAATDESPTSHR